MSDPRHQRRVITDYDSLHDPHARNYLCKPTVKNLLLKQGLITPEGHVKCSLKQFNHYREYLSTIYNQCLEDYVHDNVISSISQALLLLIPMKNQRPASLKIGCKMEKGIRMQSGASSVHCGEEARHKTKINTGETAEKKS